MKEAPHELPEPHVLDFDWRYTDETVRSLLRLVRPSDSVLAIGAPSLARYLESLGRDVLLVDRQPFHAVRNHVQIEPGIIKPDFEKRTIAILDPPWYPEEARIWIAWSAHGLVPNGEILVSLWPDITRPTAAREFDELRAWASEWAEFEVLNIVPRYVMPPFEFAAVEASENLALPSPRFGRLVSLRLKRLPSLLGYPADRETWVRFVLNDYQLALRLRGDHSLPDEMNRHPLGKDWTWPYVSRRAPKRDLISLWTSRNEVALIKDPFKALQQLRLAFHSSDSASFCEKLGPFRQLKNFGIPRPPYQRLLEWQHQQ